MSGWVWVNGEGTIFDGRPSASEQRNAAMYAIEASGIIEIWYDSAMVTDPAMSAISLWLSARADKRVIWRRRGDHNVISLAAPSGHRPSHPATALSDARFQAERHLLSMIPLGSVFGHLLQAASPAGAVCYKQLCHWLESSFEGRFLLVEAKGSQLIIVEDNGRGRTYQRPFTHYHSAPRIEDHPDPDYGKWVAARYREILAEGAPALEKVETLIRRPRRGYSLERYWRLLIPLTATDGRRFLLCATTADLGLHLGVDTRIEVGREVD